MNMSDDTDEQKLIDLSRKVASVTYISWQEVRQIIQQFVGEEKVFSLISQIDELAREVNRAPRPKNKGYSGYWTDSPQRRELVTRHGPRSLEKSNRNQRRRFRNIKRKGVKHVRSRRRNSEDSRSI